MFKIFQRSLSTSPRLFTSHYFGDSLSHTIPTVKLACDRHSSETSSTDRSPLIILHGLFGSKSNSRTVAKKLASTLSREVFCLDLRNFGDSPHDQRLDYPALAADVERFIDEENFARKPILVGHSMGAKTAMAVALRRPELLEMVVSVDNAPVAGLGGGSFSKYVNQLRLSVEKYQYTNIKDVDAKLAEVEPAVPVRQFLLTNLNRGRKDDKITSKVPLDVIGESIIKGNIASWPFDPSVTRWTGPALFIRGMQSNYVPDDVLPDIGRYFPDFEVRDVDAGHWLISEKPEEFMGVLLDWVERRED